MPYERARARILLARANKILDLARAYGIEPSDFDDVDDPVHIPAPSDTYHY